MTDLWTNERRVYAAGFTAVCGCDEAGAGPLAGPVYAAAVILAEDAVPDGVNDSKKLSAKRREALAPLIKSAAVAWAIASVSAREIDEINILNARMLAMRRAVEALEPRADFVLIDGNCDRGFAIPHECIVGGDGLSANIAAASILAKVERDAYMRRLDAEFPGYGFAGHKGYGTKLHYEALSRLGACPEHRLTYLRKFYEREQS